MTPTTRRQSVITLYARPEHRKAAKMVGFALIRGTPCGWSDLADWLSLGLSEADRAALAFTALRALPPELRCMVAEAAFVPDDPLNFGTVEAAG